VTSPSPPPPSSSSSGPRFTRQVVNRSTCLPYQQDLAAYRAFTQSRALPLPDAYAKALELEGRARLAEAEDTADGYRLYHVRSADYSGARVISGHGDHLVMGRHTQCDIILPDDPVTSLRHVLVRSWILDDGLPLISLLDLESGSRQRSVVASGPLAFRVGTTWLIGLPRRGDLPKTMEAPVVRQSDASPYRVNPNAGLLPLSGPRASRITIVPMSVRLTGAPVLQAHQMAALQPSDAYEIVLQTGNRIACVRLSERDVGHGVLLGRDPKCIDAGVRAIFDEGVSRVHALIIRDRDAVRIYDIASTHGMTDHIAKIRSAPLETGARVFLRCFGAIAVNWRELIAPPR
jgi:hypothetical protein